MTSIDVLLLNHALWNHRKDKQCVDAENLSASLSLSPSTASKTFVSSADGGARGRMTQDARRNPEKPSEPSILPHKKAPNPPQTERSLEETSPTVARGERKDK